jgi:hypothetical protein
MRNKTVKMIPYEAIVTSELKQGAFLRKDFPGFWEDYLVVHCLIRRYQPNTFFEIGTSGGQGTNVICKAMGIKRFRLWGVKSKKVYSLDVPPNTDPSIIYPDAEDGHPPKAGELCKYPYTQLYGFSTEFDYTPYYPIEAWFIDGKHNYEYVTKDTEKALDSTPRLIIWHDVQIDSVREAIIDVMAKHGDYYLYRAGEARVYQTRVAFAALGEPFSGS